MDREASQTELREKVPVLDIDDTTFWLLQPFFDWAGLRGRYLMSNISSIRTEMVPDSVTPPYIHTPKAGKGIATARCSLQKSPDTHCGWEKLLSSNPRQDQDTHPEG
ncbi:uncharacterized protein FFUJ_14544 [Fusarium fujikuroi IMI 58289]|uniref:Uncharacterized protein n=1 Tax=Gibberella fujikuroi (strain CBS 195.34 / IMI 58289 / NRRL A-6831) TaxID=1279085 RepID=S0E2F2_GIBF5|nr:uncharacterized protein FFUJ_14544 [Fusarium fujikuroi IMI 58289]KLP17077.1 uncharacterized protein LW94_959 [Fusarium fujikuroi]CCT67837.1 uncharacterized protein FFUJ_14544 [Fusarium fujikuroi IMI 58289]SCO21541.1 uncharacterized protein FFM5_12674 [Fusarium fujikuroi]SCO41829.1 uncharacterized protein FFMR_06543 [Fusarium fujikuroi]